MMIRNVSNKSKAGAFGVCAAGETVDVDDDLAGAAPSGTSPGSGLLAQTDVWRPGAAKKAAAQKAEEKSETTTTEKGGS